MSFGFSVGDFLALIELVNKSRKRWVDAPVEYKALTDETKSLSNILHNLEDIVTQIDLTPRQQGELEHCRLACVVILEELKELEDKYIYLGLPAKGLRAHARKAWKRSNLEPEDVRTLRLRMSSSITMLAAVYDSINLHMNSRTHDEVLGLRKTHEENEKMIVAEWFARATFAEQHTDLISRRLSGTGQWVLDSSEFQGWLACQTATLLCPGIPGSGKTMIASTVIDDLHTRFSGNENIGIVYYYFDYATRSDQTLNHVLSSCIRQLIQARPSLPAAAKAIYEQHKDRQTHVSKVYDLWTLIAELSDLYSKVFFVIDALDECRNDDLTRDNLVSGLFAQQLQSHIKVQLFATSRPIQQITDRFSPTNQLEVRASVEDVHRYLDAQMPRLFCVAKHANLQDAIKDVIVRVADGMFLLAKLHFDSLTNYTKPRDVRRALEALPKGNEALTLAYQGARVRIDGQPEPHRNLAHRVLTFVTYAERVMRIEELQHALAVEPGMTQIDPDEDLDEESLLLSLCAGLVMIDPESRHVRFVHYTTQEYLERIREDWLTGGRLDIARCCMAYLTMDAFRCGRMETGRRIYLPRSIPRFRSLASNEESDEEWNRHLDEESSEELEEGLDGNADEHPDEHPHEKFAIQVKRFPFVDHAAKLWGNYVLDTQEFHIIHEVCDFLLDGGTLDFITEVMLANFTYESSYDGGFINFGAANISPLHVAAIFGLTGTTLQLIHRGCDMNAIDSTECTPLLRAAKNGHLEVVEVLLARPGIRVNIADEDGVTALQYATSRNHLEVVKALLAHPEIDVSIANEDAETALSLAARHRYLEIVKLLLAQPGIDVNTKDDHRETVLYTAADAGHLEEVKVLLAHPRIDVNVANAGGRRTALHAAASSGHIEIVKELLAYSEVDVNQVGTYVGTALSMAASSGHLEVLKVLLAHPSVDVNRANTDSRLTALHYAAEWGHLEIVKELLAHPEIDLNKLDGCGYFTALHLAAELGHIEIVKELLAHPEIDVNVGSENDYTTSRAARLKGHIEVAELLEKFSPEARSE